MKLTETLKVGKYYINRNGGVLYISSVHHESDDTTTVGYECIVPKEGSETWRFFNSQEDVWFTELSEEEGMMHRISEES